MGSLGGGHMVAQVESGEAAAAAEDAVGEQGHSTAQRETAHEGTAQEDSGAQEDSAPQGDSNAEGDNEVQVDRSSGREILLASASQDRYGRIWSIRRVVEGAAAAATGADALSQMITRYAPKPTVQAGQHRCVLC